MKRNNFLALLFGILFIITSIIFIGYANKLNEQNKITTEYIVLNKPFDQCKLIVKERNFVSVKDVSKNFYKSVNINDKITLTESKMSNNDLLEIFPIGCISILFGTLMLIFSKKSNYL